MIKGGRYVCCKGWNVDSCLEYGISWLMGWKYGVVFPPVSFSVVANLADKQDAVTLARAQLSVR
jgi:hypothetical protein